MHDDWDEILYRVEQECGPEAAQRLSDAIDDGSVSYLIAELRGEA